MLDWTALAALFAAGLVAGALNVIAGGGSFLTLPVLIFAGLPATVANATNRVGILLQNAGAVWGFHRHRKLDWRWTALTAGPAAAGALLG
ncbi:MAG: TSUP family transporter, partial [Acidobacteriota bacterium]